MKFAKSLALAAGVSLLAASCADDLNLKPKYGLTAEQVYADPNNYINVLAKIYAGLSISGNNGPAGMPDIEESTRASRSTCASCGTFSSFRPTSQFADGPTRASPS